MVSLVGVSSMMFSSRTDYWSIHQEKRTVIRCSRDETYLQFTYVYNRYRLKWSVLLKLITVLWAYSQVCDKVSQRFSKEGIDAITEEWDQMVVHVSSRIMEHLRNSVYWFHQRRWMYVERDNLPRSRIVEPLLTVNNGAVGLTLEERGEETEDIIYSSYTRRQTIRGKRLQLSKYHILFMLRWRRTESFEVVNFC